MFDKNYFVERYDTKVMGIGSDSRRAYLYTSRLRMLKDLGIHPETVVELGCGTGSMTSWLAKKYNKVIATDISDAALMICRSRFVKNEVELIKADASSVALPSGIADMVVAFDLLEHLPKPELCLAETYRLLRHGGFFFLSTPNPSSLGARIKKRYPEYLGLPLKKRKKQWFGWQDDSHISILPINYWRVKFREAGFEIVSDGTDYLWDAPYLSWLPSLPQEILCKLLHRLLTRIRYFMHWNYGENYIAVLKKV